MNKVLLSEDGPIIDNFMSNLKIAKEKYNAVLNQFEALKTGVQLSKGQFMQLVEHPEKAIREIYKNRIPDTDPNTGLKIDTEAVMRQMQLPNLSKLIEATQNTYGMHFMEYLDIKEGKLEINESAVNTYCNRFRIYTDNPDIVELFNDIKTLEALLTKINSKTRLVTPNPGRAVLLESYIFNNGTILLPHIGIKQLIQNVK